MWVAYHDARLRLWAGCASASVCGDESAGSTSKTVWVLERSMIRYLVAVDVGRRFAESIQHVLWRFVWCLIAIAVTSFQA